MLCKSQVLNFENHFCLNLLPIRCNITDMASAGHRKRSHNSLVILLAIFLWPRHAEMAFDINFYFMTMCFRQALAAFP